MDGGLQAEEGKGVLGEEGVVGLEFFQGEVLQGPPTSALSSLTSALAISAPSPYSMRVLSA